MDCCCQRLVLPRGPGPCNSFFLRIDRNASTAIPRRRRRRPPLMPAESTYQKKRKGKNKISARSSEWMIDANENARAASPCPRRATLFGTKRNIAIVRASAPKHADIPVGLLDFYIFIASRIVLASAGTPTSFARKIRDIEFTCHPSAANVPPSPSFLRPAANRFAGIETLSLVNDAFPQSRYLRLTSQIDNRVTRPMFASEKNLPSDSSTTRRLATLSLHVPEVSNLSGEISIRQARHNAQIAPGARFFHASRRKERGRRHGRTKGRVGVGAGSSRWSKRSRARKRETTILLPTDIRYKLGRAITAFATFPSFLPPTLFPPFVPLKSRNSRDEGWSEGGEARPRVVVSLQQAGARVLRDWNNRIRWDLRA